MGIYYRLVNLDKREYVEPERFSGGNIKFSAFTGGVLAEFCFNLMRGEWAGDRVVLAGDETGGHGCTTEEWEEIKRSECLSLYTFAGDHFTELTPDGG